MKVLLFGQTNVGKKTLSALIESVKGVTATRVSSLEEGAAALQKSDFDVVVVVVGEPASKALRMVSNVVALCPAAPVIALSETDDDSLADAAVDVGAQDCLLKGETDARILNRALRYAVTRKYGERAIRGSEAFLHASLDALDSQIAILDEKGRILFTNLAWRKFSDEIGVGEVRYRVGSSYLEYSRATALKWKSHATFVARGIESLCSGKEQDYTFEYGAPIGGDKRWFVMRAARFQVGEVARVLVAHQDVTARKKAEHALQESERRYYETVSHIPGAVFQFQLHPDGTYEFPFVSEGSERLIGMTPKEIEADPKNVFERVVPEDLGPLWDSILVSATQESTWAGEFRYRLSDGEVKWLRGSSTPRRMGNGSIRWDAVFLDITEQKRTEEQLFLSRRLESVGKLAGGIAHDFNNLLTVVSGRAQLLKRRLEPDNPIQRDIEIMEGATKRASALTKQLLAFSRRQMLQPKVLRINDVIRNMEEVLLPLLGEDIELITELPEEVGAIKVDPTQMEQVILNLAVNAREAMLKGGRLVFESANVELNEEYAREHIAVVPGPYVRLSVSDTGMGMDKDTQGRIFEPFFSTKQKKGGAGLGLSTVYGIVKQSGGNIWVYSEVGKGTTFKLYLPRVESFGADKGVAAPVGAEAPPRATSETVLLVEDEDALRDVIEEVLSEAGYAVIAAANGLEALDAANKRNAPIHLLLTDIVMPEMGGLEVARRLKAQRPDIRVLFMSGYAEKAAVRNQILEDGSNFLEKPFSTDILEERVRRALTNPPTDAKMPASAGNMLG